jgi:threonine dehydratase
MTQDPEPSGVRAPTKSEIRANRERLRELVRTTPTWAWRGPLAERLFPGIEVYLKLELFQYAGSFKVRGALTNMLELEPDLLRRGVTGVSAGNHAMAVGYAARVLNTRAKIVMPKNANPARIAGCRAFGVDVVLVDDVHQAFEEVHRIEREERMTFVHPFEGLGVALGTATLGLELCEQVQDLDAVIIPIGGGGLCAGVACAVKQWNPDCRVYGVEPSGADTMHRSFASGKLESIDQVRTIADSLGAPHTAPYSLALCRRFVDELVMVDDDLLCAGMAVLFQEAKLAVEPAGAATTAALLGPARERLRGKRVGLIVCGANIDSATFASYLARGFDRLAEIRP